MGAGGGERSLTGEKARLDEGSETEETGEEEVAFFLAGEGVRGL